MGIPSAAVGISLSLLLLLLLLLCGFGCVSGVIYEDHYPGGAERSVYAHFDANGFGASDYDTGLVPIVIASPSNLCELNADWALNAAGSIVLIARGNCTFVSKSLRAQIAGAKGVLIGSLLGDDVLLQMSAGDDDPDAGRIDIPVVSIAQNVFWDIRDRIGNAKRRNETSWAQLNDEGRQSAEGPDFQFGGSLKFLTIIILVLPGIWLTCFLVYWGRRHCTQRLNRDARQRIAASIPLTAFRREAHMSSPAPASGTIASAPAAAAAAAAPALETKSGDVTAGATTIRTAGGAAVRPKRRIHNESCTVCLEDFTDGEMVKVLPCQHAFHAPCIDPWLDERADTCPICKQSIILPEDQSTFAKLCCCLPAACRHACGCCNPPAAAIAVAGGGRGGAEIAAAAAPVPPLPPRPNNSTPAGIATPLTAASAVDGSATPTAERTGAARLDFQMLELSEPPAAPTPVAAASATADGGAAAAANASEPVLPLQLSTSDDTSPV